MAPLVSQLIIDELLEPRAYNQLECYANAVLWARTEGAIPAPETSHAISVAVEEAKKAKEEGKEKVILLNWSGHGIMDLGGYESYFSGRLVDYPLPQEEMMKSLKDIEGWPKPKIMKKGKVVG
jgi:tryptophan synthase beta chain